MHTDASKEGRQTGRGKQGAQMGGDMIPNQTQAQTDRQTEN